MSCEYGKDDCLNYDDKCYRCIDAIHYLEPKVKNFGLKNNINVKSKRQGNQNEVIAYKQTQDALNVTGTPNSGAGKVKGDLQIGSMAMIECKTTTKKNEGRQPGKESFSIKREWLEKLDKEAKESGKEFFYLVFSFKENDQKLYVVSDIEQYNSMLSTMKYDRTELKKSQNINDINIKKANYIEAKNTKLLAEIELLKAEIKYLKEKDKINLFA